MLGRARQRHQRRQRQARRRQQIDAAGAQLRQHLRVAAKLAVGENRDVEPAAGLRPDGVRGLDQPDRQRVGFRRIDAQLELEFGSGAGRFANEAGGQPG
jgi:hypothetical protein